MFVPNGTTQFIATIGLADDSGDAITGVTFDDADLSLQTRKANSSGSWVDVVLVAGTLGTFTANSWVEIGEGLYQLCVNASLLPSAGVNTDIRLQYADYQPQFDTLIYDGSAQESAATANKQAVLDAVGAGGIGARNITVEDRSITVE